MVEGGDDLAMRKVSSCTKEDNDVWIGNALNAKSGAERILAAALWCCLLPFMCNAQVADRAAPLASLAALHSGFTACPPN